MLWNLKSDVAVKRFDLLLSGHAWFLLLHFVEHFVRVQLMCITAVIYSFTHVYKTIALCSVS